MIPLAYCESDHARETDDAREIAVALHRRSRSIGRGQEHRAGAGARGQGSFQVGIRYLEGAARAL
jgi:hypothetical protein